MRKYVYELPGWPLYEYSWTELASQLEVVVSQRGELFGKLSALGFEDLQQTQLDAIAAEIVKSSEIEGEHLDLDVVRGSVARWLGINRGGVPSGDRYTEEVVAMAMDAAQKPLDRLTKDRLFNWHSALFPSGRNVFGKLRVGEWRDDAKGPMQVVSNVGRRETVHFEAPAATRVDGEMQKFFDWFDQENEPSPVLKAGISHLWFVTIHPLDDGNGRIGRNILDMALARSDRRPYRCYSVSSQILKERNGYYDSLEATQKGNGDYTEWLSWFLGCFGRSLSAAIEVVSGAMARTRFWQVHKDAALNDRQRMVVSKMLIGFDGKMTNKKYATISKCSDATATRDLGELVAKGIFMTDGGGGRSVAYAVVPVN